MVLGLSLDFVSRKTGVFLENAKILKSSYMQYSKQAHKSLVSYDDKSVINITTELHAPFCFSTWVMDALQNWTNALWILNVKVENASACSSKLLHYLYGFLSRSDGVYNRPKVLCETANPPHGCRRPQKLNQSRYWFFKRNEVKNNQEDGLKAFINYTNQKTSYQKKNLEPSLCWLRKKSQKSKKKTMQRKVYISCPKHYPGANAMKWSTSFSNENLPLKGLGKL